MTWRIGQNGHLCSLMSYLFQKAVAMLWDSHMLRTWGLQPTASKELRPAKILVSDLRRDSSTPGKSWDNCGTGKQLDYKVMSDPKPKSPAETLSGSWPLEIIWDNEYLLSYAVSWEIFVKQRLITNIRKLPLPYFPKIFNYKWLSISPFFLHLLN